MGEEGSGVLWGWVGVMKGLCNDREKEREREAFGGERERENGRKINGPSNGNKFGTHIKMVRI